jgi:hypothetical protein
MSLVPLSPRRSIRRWPIIASVIVLLLLLIGLFGWWRLERNGVAIKSFFPLEVTMKGELHFNAVAGGHNGRSFWFFSTAEDEFLFAIGCENIRGPHPLYPGLQAWVSNDLLLPSFDLQYSSQHLRVHYDANSDSLEIQGKRFDRQRGKILLLRGEPRAFEMEQYDVAVDQKVFKDLGGLYLLDEIDRVVPPGKRK